MVELGHEVVAREVEVKELAGVTAREHPDVALVGLGVFSQRALDLIGEIVHESICSVFALLNELDPVYVRDAARRGVFAYIVENTPDRLQSALEITLRRFTEYHDLQGSMRRKAHIEQAKGILMARNMISADDAFTLLRVQSQHTGRKLADIATAIVESYLLLAPAPAPRPDP